MSETLAPPSPINGSTPRIPEDDDGMSRPNYGDGGGDDPQPQPEPERTPAPEPENAVPPTPPAALPDDGADEDEERDPLLFLIGSRKLGVKVGGFKPDSTVLKIKGGKIDVDGQWDMGDRFPAVFDLQVTGNLDRHGIELESGTIKSQKRSQEATICGTTSLPVYLERKLGEDPDLLAAVLSKLGVDD